MNAQVVYNLHIIYYTKKDIRKLALSESIKAMPRRKKKKKKKNSPVGKLIWHKWQTLESSSHTKW